jgi:hypothetical protein
MKKLIAALLCAVIVAAADYSLAGRVERWANGLVPSSSTLVVSGTVYVDEIKLANKSAGSVTVTIIDASTDCSSAACEIVPTVSIAANTLYTIRLGGIIAPNGIRWSASSGTAIAGQIKYRTGI